MLEPGARRFGKSTERPHLIHHHGIHICRRNGHFPTAEPHQVRVSGMSSQGCAALYRQTHRLFHDGRIPCMESAGNVGGSHQRQYLVIHADFVGAEAFSQIRVQINFHNITPFLCYIPNI